MFGISKTGSIVAAMAGLLLTAGVSMAMEPAMTSKTDKGDILTNAKGMTLYTFDKDSAGKSACNGKCAENWPVLKAGADAMTMGKWSVIKRDDGTMQWAYEGKPLYAWVKDQKPGDTTGDGVNGVWHTAKP